MRSSSNDLAMEIQNIRRILVIGSGGAGKSTLTNRLAKKLSLPAIYLDRHYWKPNWKETESEVWRTKVSALVKAEDWIMDGNFSGTLDIRIPRAELIIDLAYSRWICLTRVFRRMAKYWGQTRPDLPEGCPEGFDFDFLKWVYHFPTKSRPKLEKLIREHSCNKPYLKFKSPRDLADWLSTI
jgi:adenylate kinase family enzyme